MSFRNPNFQHFPKDSRRRFSAFVLYCQMGLNFKSHPFNTVDGRNQAPVAIYIYIDTHMKLRFKWKIIHALSWKSSLV